jgi:hypothetical protein
MPLSPAIAITSAGNPPTTTISGPRSSTTCSPAAPIPVTSPSARTATGSVCRAPTSLLWRLARHSRHRRPRHRRRPRLPLRSRQHPDHPPRRQTRLHQHRRPVRPARRTRPSPAHPPRRRKLADRRRPGPPRHDRDRHLLDEANRHTMGERPRDATSLRQTSRADHRRLRRTRRNRTPAMRHDDRPCLPDQQRSAAPRRSNLPGLRVTRPIPQERLTAPGTSIRCGPVPSRCCAGQAYSLWVPPLALFA